MKPPKQPVISQDKKDLLNLRRLPARLTAKEAALVLGCKAYDIPVLEQLGLLKPLARSEKNHVRHYAAVAGSGDDAHARKSEMRWVKRNAWNVNCGVVSCAPYSCGFWTLPTAW